MITSEFLFALCQKGAEKALKSEVARARPELKPAYQRPGVVTFKSPRPMTPDERIDAVLARVSGISLRTERDIPAAVERLRAIPAPLRLHVIERELFRPDEAPPGHPGGELARRTETALREALPGTFLEGSAAAEGDLVIDVVVAPDDPILLGAHRHTKDRSPHPGGRLLYEVPPEAPSRAYRKTEEAILAFALPVAAGDTAVELGAAPGGGSLALLRRGVSVVAVDPAEMDARIVALTGAGGARLTHLRLPMQRVERAQLPSNVHWLLMDVNLAPQVALRAAAHVASLCRSSLLGVVFTLKLNDWSFLDALPSFLQQAREMGVVEPRVRQLPAHRQEVVLAGLTERGRKRVGP